MYHFIVKKIIIRAFHDMSQGNYKTAFNQFSPNIHFHFEGDHSMGSELHSLPAIQKWFERVFRIFPGLQFTVKQVIISGWPWDTVAASQLQVQATLKNGQIYQNSVVQILHLCWGRVVDDYLLENTQKLADTLKEIAKLGMEEAIAPPITD